MRSMVEGYAQVITTSRVSTLCLPSMSGSFARTPPPSLRDGPPPRSGEDYFAALASEPTARGTKARPTNIAGAITAPQ